MSMKVDTIEAQNIHLSIKKNDQSFYFTLMFETVFPLKLSQALIFQ